MYIQWPITGLATPWCFELTRSFQNAISPQPSTMAPAKELSDKLRHKILCARLDQKTYGQIERELGVRRETCYKVVKRFKTSGTYTKASGRAGKSKLSQRDLRVLQREFMKNNRAPLADITNASRLNISTATVRQYKKKLRISLHSLKQKPWLDRKMRRSRLGWCRDNSNWNRRTTRKRIWSDETAIKIESFQVQKVWSKPGTKCPIRPSFPSSRMTLHFWAAITYNNRTPLIFVRRRTPEERKHSKDRLGMNSDQYINEVLQPHLLPFWNRTAGASRDALFMQDRSGPHSSKKTTRFLAQNGIRLLSWPGNSPDLNPIENAWHLLKVRLRKRFRDPRKRPHSQAEWIQAAQEEWDRIPQKVLNNLIDSVPRRIRACIRARGGYTKY